MIKIEIKNVAATSRQITSSKTGKSMTFHEQEAWAFTMDDQGQPYPYPQRIMLNIDVDRGQQPYPVGVYQLAPESVYVNGFNRLEIGRAKLRPLQTNVKAAA